ncbi:MAG TPA: hypothetical protein VKU61_00425, partial [Candidatus Binatia bacterium]|nr:hypothetical protein [Candidatus Binatia bacterium]
MRLVCSTLALVVLATLPAAAQTPVTAATDARGAPGGAVVATFRSGATVATGAQRGAETLVTIDGWVTTSLLGPKRDSFPASAAAKSMLRVRTTPSAEGTIVADLKPGTGLKTVEKQGMWTHVRRGVWVTSSVLGKAVARAPAPAKPAA